MDLGLRGRAAAVAASSKGIGRATALMLAREGASVAICARGEEALLATEADLRAAGVDVLAKQLDISEPDAPKAFVDSAIEAFGRLDVVVANAGGPPAGTFDDFDDSAFEAALQANLFSTIRLCRAAVPHMRERGWGRIVNMASISVREPQERLILSNTARAGGAGFAKSMANELATTGITVNTVSPGLTLTDRVLALAKSDAEATGRTEEDVLVGFTRDVRMKRLGAADEIAALIVFLCSEQAAFITGTTIAVDGGTTRFLL